MAKFGVAHAHDRSKGTVRPTPRRGLTRARYSPEETTVLAKPHDRVTFYSFETDLIHQGLRSWFLVPCTLPLQGRVTRLCDASDVSNQKR